MWGVVGCRVQGVGCGVGEGVGCRVWGVEGRRAQQRAPLSRTELQETLHPVGCRVWGVVGSSVYRVG